MDEIVMPRLSDTMEEGTILRWLKAEGDHVARGEELVEIETDKATMTYQSDQAGVLQILASEGDTLPVGEPIARVGALAPDGASSSSAASEEPAAGSPREGGRIKASPLARRIARENDVDLSTLSGSGPGGRIVKADVPTAGGGGEEKKFSTRAGARARASEPSFANPPASPSPLEPAVATAKGETTTVELSRTQQTIARRMAESKATIPDFALQAEVDMEECVKLRSELKRLSHSAQAGVSGSPSGDGLHRDGAHESGGGGVPTYNDMIVKACALALREHPRANGGYRDGRVQLHSRVNVGVAVATPDALVVPTVFDAEEKSLGEIARETRALAERVRTGTITPPELGGGTFTVSNLGMFGVRSFTAIVNPPQAAILSVGSLERRAVVTPDGGEIVARHMMAVTLVCDHRILYGADAALFLARIRELLETPAALNL